MDKDLQKLIKEMKMNKDFSMNGVSGSDAIRSMMFDVLGVEEGSSSREMYRGFRENKEKLFQIIDVIVDETLPSLVGNEFDSLANYHSVAIGDNIRFRNPNNKLFRVARVAAGTQDIRRQNMLPQSYTVETDWYAVKTYAELEQFLNGQVDWNVYVQNVARSFAHEIGSRIFDAISKSYDGIRATRKVSGAFDIDQLLTLVGHVKASAGTQSVAVYGTEAALLKIARDESVTLSDRGRDELNRLGTVGSVLGIELRALPNAFRAGTEEFIVDDNTLLIIPSDEKIVDVVLEGEAITQESDALAHNALQMEFVTMKKLGIAVRQAAVYGYYKLV